jgi:hypothetical protein
MWTFDYEASAELFAAHGTSLEVNDERYNGEQIRALYDSERYPLSRNKPSM